MVITREREFWRISGDLRTFAVSFSFSVLLGFEAVYADDFLEPAF